MAFKVVSKLALASSKADSGLLSTAHRSFATLSRSSTLQCSRTTKSSFSKPIAQQTFKRSYADSISPVTKRRGRGFFRWTWRLTYVSAIGGIGYLGYNIYSLRTPQEQFDPDPSKKTLVILGTSMCELSMALSNMLQVLAGVLSLS